MAKKNTLNDLNEFLKETQEGQDTNNTKAETATEKIITEKITKEAFLAKEPSQLVDVNKVEKTATGTKKTTTKKAPAKATTKKTTASKSATSKTTSKTTTKTTAGKATTAKKAPAKTTTRKTTASKATTKSTPKSNPKKTTTPKVEVTEEAILKQLDALAQKEGVTMREIWERVAVKIGATDTAKTTVAEEAFDSLVDIAMTPMNFLVSVSDRINKML